ncbi:MULTISPECIES: octaprenyl diphosphate synthase [Pseudoalteromonas]|jgi:octaprenyl-diphosphate synthase|uniref:Octaprenyl-diphosphate synthase n=1 Tax=Pseudoalteromonas agarivorans DSM 14585 TaxID=1312369 RepID=A0ACA8E060_9GAMM|nr:MULTISPECIES: octaprenyl diphosphate synthase [Pseudoalteromonas]MDC9520105.1 octaprenyl diphosphate synthase [Pseudoalteromonas sp. Angola-31]MDY6887230.1 octaprenyl diphosphate synthase [Pseudomonadota bacterium]HBW97360.1 octaprenyl diphosphate synthase [Pseudoalteromonas sp.]ATC83544.1 octaprenyl-diphosphate synthase [Pseudoalteromonas agarivorans DSM 14585]AZN33822.1 octaprenyl diphosphate synthase [Pseudoalteromonas sp. Xi13]|tara:strand:- start:572 stop:1543 length:972 start_codon:yes stop_codon:yes gene_type:complete
MDIKAIQALIESDMNDVNQLIHAQMRSDVALVNQLGLYIVNSGGKRVRPMLAILAARALGYQGKDHITLATIVEFIHTATLLHDDVVDESNLRRGTPTANAEFGNAASVLVGDFIYTRSFQLMVGLGKMQIMQVLADATNVIAEGEVLQLMNCNDPNTTEASYMQVIYSKTAKLFEAATGLAAIITEQDNSVLDALNLYGMHLGTAFQLVDDVLDYNADADQLGKNIGDDLAEGKPTLPLIYAMKHGSDQQRALIRDAIEHCNGMDNLEAILTALKQTNALEFTMQKAQQEADKAIACLDFLAESQYKQALISLARIAVERDH